MAYVEMPWRGSIAIYHIEGNMYVTREYLPKYNELTMALQLVISSLLYIQMIFHTPYLMVQQSCLLMTTVLVKGTDMQSVYGHMNVALK